MFSVCVFFFPGVFIRLEIFLSRLPKETHHMSKICNFFHYDLDGITIKSPEPRVLESYIVLCRLKK